ncbi:radical SAM protein [Paucibacter sp. APW11]|uniref:Radical SAM protein n=1 Tax=Roseateles aquae TaxID=3077235 RepID=A0ABU3P559_9BURK|nr:radical SAM protein [Paucibacter sp. APW11]MDT8997713.1 radical SAM protein [Paucibacter sp. APW11]
MNAEVCDVADPLSYEANLGALLGRHPELQIGRDEYNINVTANFGERLEAAELFERYKAHPGAGKPAHLYYHFPLCDYICHFCNYVKQLASPTSRAEQLNRWTDALIKESSLYARDVPWTTKALIQSFYIGGGTAAILTPEHLKRILDHVHETFSVTPDCELNVEGNPDNFHEYEKVAALTKIGFNRFSVGVQSFTPEVNSFTNRGHSPEMSVQAIMNLKEVGKPFNVDMMFGLPYQTPDTVSDDIRTLVEMRVPTITIYRLRNADRQSMGIGNRAAWNVPKIRNRIIEQDLFPSLETTYEMRERAVGHLLKAGYEPSPCGWWSLPGTYPEGNIPRVSRNKWQRFDTMLAFGPGAYGWLAGANQSALQTHNSSDINGYLHHMESSDQPPLAYGRLLTGNQAAATALGFAYKSRQPIEVERFKNEYGVDISQDEPYRSIFEELQSKGLIRATQGGRAYVPTLNGEALHEEIISVYLHDRIGSFTTAVCNKVG